MKHEPAPHRDLAPLFRPRSVAILGASDDPAKWGNRLALGALRGAHRRGVYLVNRRGGEVLGQRTYPSLAELPEAPELVVVCVPAAGFEAAVDDALAAGARALIGISAGLGESGEEGRRREAAVVERVRAAGALLLGPNCLGVADLAADLHLGWDPFPAGPLGVISQSGNLALELAVLAEERGLGFSRFASLGNQADVEIAELIGALAEDEATRAIAIYCEDFRAGRHFAAAAAEAVAGGTPVYLLAGGRSDASARAAASHTGALVSGQAAIDAACRAAGIVRVATQIELVDLAQSALARSLPRGRRIAVFGDGGGHGVIAADAAADHGLEVPAFSEELRARLRAALPDTASVGNPVDFAGASDDWLGAFTRVTDLLLGSDEVDAALMTGYFCGYCVMGEEFGAQEAAAAADVAAAAAASGKPLAVHTIYPRTASAGVLRTGGVPVYGDVALAARALAGLHDRTAPPAGVPALPEPAAPLAAAGYLEARALLAAGGVPLTRAGSAASASEARLVAAAIGYPVAVKALGLLHKSDAGGVALGLADGDAVAAAFADMRERLGSDGVTVEEMAPLADGAELIVGVVRDPRFGPIAMIGLGGIYAEILEDVAVGLAPLDAEAAEALIRSLRGSGILTGARGRRPLDVAAAARACAALTEVAAAHPEIAELEVNPLLVLPDGAVGLDARVVLG